MNPFLRRANRYIENDTRKLKIGDGATKLADLKYFGGDSAKHFDVVPTDGEEDVAAITRVVASAEIHTGDTAIVKREITTGKTSYTAYVYDGDGKAAYRYPIGGGTGFGIMGQIADQNYLIHA